MLSVNLLSPLMLLLFEYYGRCYRGYDSWCFVFITSLSGLFYTITNVIYCCYTLVCYPNVAPVKD